MKVAKQTEDGAVTESLPNIMFRVKLDSGRELIAYLAGKMKVNKIKVNVGDRVRVEPDEGKTTSRIVRRL